MTRIRDVTRLSEALDESLEDFDDFEGAGDEVVHFSSAGIDDLFPWLENHRFQSERAESLWQFSRCRQITCETLESCGSPGCIGVFTTNPIDVLWCEGDHQIGGFDVVPFDLLTPMLWGCQTDAGQGFTRSPTDRLTVHCQSSRRHDVEVGAARPNVGAGHH